MFTLPLCAKNWQITRSFFFLFVVDSICYVNLKNISINMVKITFSSDVKVFCCCKECDTNIINGKEIKCDNCSNMFHLECIIPKSCDSTVDDLIHLCKHCAHNKEIFTDQNERTEIEIEDVNVKKLRSRTVHLDAPASSQIPIRRRSKKVLSKEATRTKSNNDKFEEKSIGTGNRDDEKKPCNCSTSFESRLSNMEHLINEMANRFEENDNRSFYLLKRIRSIEGICEKNDGKSANLLKSIQSIESIIDGVHREINVLVDTIRDCQTLYELSASNDTKVQNQLEELTIKVNDGIGSGKNFNETYEEILHYVSQTLKQHNNTIKTHFALHDDYCDGVIMRTDSLFNKVERKKHGSNVNKGVVQGSTIASHETMKATSAPENHSNEREEKRGKGNIGEEVVTHIQKQSLSAPENHSSRPQRQPKQRVKNEREKGIKNGDINENAVTHTRLQTLSAPENHSKRRQRQPKQNEMKERGNAIEEKKKNRNANRARIQSQTLCSHENNSMKRERNGQTRSGIGKRTQTQTDDTNDSKPTQIISGDNKDDGKQLTHTPQSSGEHTIFAQSMSHNGRVNDRLIRLCINDTSQFINEENIHENISKALFGFIPQLKIGAFEIFSNKLIFDPVSHKVERCIMIISLMRSIITCMH